jgi:hypothetical protein
MSRRNMLVTTMQKNYIHRNQRAYVGILVIYRGADKSLAQPGRKQATATEDFDFHVSYL